MQLPNRRALLLFLSGIPVPLNPHPFGTVWAMDVAHHVSSPGQHGVANPGSSLTKSWKWSIPEHPCVQRSFKTVLSSLVLAKLAQLEAALCELGQEVNGSVFWIECVYLHCNELCLHYCILPVLYHPSVLKPSSSHDKNRKYTSWNSIILAWLLEIIFAVSF